MEQIPKNKFSQWLETLQQESWQLELLISGFVIFLLAGVYEPITNLEMNIQLLVSNDWRYSQLYFPYYVLMGTWFILIINLSAHVLLRALWIGAIGLRYVSGDIDVPFLGYSPGFERFIKEKVGSFDKYIELLEKLCSTIFAYTFLIIFIVIGGAIYTTIGQILGYTEYEELGIQIPIITILYNLGGLIYLFDFITLGKLKRHQGIFRYYFPIYRFYGWITLAPLYRALYYNFIDDRYGRMVLWSIIPYFLLIAMYLSLDIQTNIYLPENRYRQSLQPGYYDDTWEPSIPWGRANIPSRHIQNGFIPLHLPYVPNNDDRVIQAICPDLKPAKTGISIFSIDPARTEMNAYEALDCSARRFKIYVNDSLMTDLHYRFYDHPVRKRTGLNTTLDVDYLPRGEHFIEINVLLFMDPDQDSLQFYQTDIIPFWKE